MFRFREIREIKNREQQLPSVLNKSYLGDMDIPEYVLNDIEELLKKIDEREIS